MNSDLVFFRMVVRSVLIDQIIACNVPMIPKTAPVNTSFDRIFAEGKKRAKTSASVSFKPPSKYCFGIENKTP